ncbi:MAG: alpha/beta hydrolase [Christensenellaceae bacterium]|jgi:acetyl esterase/lipase|nr:alpha/beta hydrolase [Christensenellaceae bacterium]
MEERIWLWEDGKTPLYDESKGQRPFLTCYPLDNKPRAAALICPGGGYIEKVAHEKLPVVKAMHAMGLHAFILDYRVAPYAWPAPIVDANRGVRLLRARAAEFNIKPDKIAVIGFSAGGHLCAMSGCRFDYGDENAADPIERVSSRPDMIIPCYAVLSMEDGLSHPGSKKALTAGLKVEEVDAVKSVRDDTPPCFLFHTEADELVPLENSLLFAGALQARKVPYALHVFPFGRHGLAMAEETPLAKAWPSLLEAFLREFGF